MALILFRRTWPHCPDSIYSVQYSSCIVALVLCSHSTWWILFYVPLQVQLCVDSVSVWHHSSFCRDAFRCTLYTLCFVFFNLSAVQSKLSVKNHFVTFWTLLSFVLFHSELFLLFDVGEIKKLHVNKWLTHCKPAVFLNKGPTERLIQMNSCADYKYTRNTQNSYKEQSCHISFVY